MKESIIHRGIEKFKRTFFPLRRYEYLFQTIRDRRCKRIMEIGTWTGKRAEQMIEAAGNYHPLANISYYGFDLFELLTEKLNEEEFSKRPPTEAEVKERLFKTGANINLYKGFTHETMPPLVGRLPKMDLIYIDGGHKVETIENDWKYSKEFMDENTVVIFDDYYHKYDSVGCKKVVEKIDKEKYNVEILPRRDRVITPWWKLLEINFVRVTKKRQ